MYLKRIEKILKLTEAEALLINAQPEIFYLSGFTSEDAVLVITNEKRFIVTDSRYFIQAGEQAADFCLVDISEKAPSNIIKEETIKKIGFLDKSVTYDWFKRIQQKLPAVEFIGVSTLIEDVRKIKSADEINKIKKAAEIADAGFCHILKYIKAGMAELDVALELEFFMRKNGASALSFETICASGKRSAMPHGAASSKIIEEGDFVTLDFGCVYSGYVSDMTRTVVAGRADDKQKEIYNTVLCAQKEALLKIRAGEKAKEIDKIARDIIAKKGYGKNFGHGLGHSLGLCVHEAPSLSPKSEAVLKTDMLMTVEPGIYIENFGGVRIEDLVVIKENGCINLTSSPKELIEL